MKYNFKLGQKVKGSSKFYQEKLERHISVDYEGTIIHDFKDGSYLVATEEKEELLIELYDHDTMEEVIETQPKAKNE